jgi:hypothetical protein
MKMKFISGFLKVNHIGQLGLFKAGEKIFGNQNCERGNLNIIISIIFSTYIEFG